MTIIQEVTLSNLLVGDRVKKANLYRFEGGEWVKRTPYGYTSENGITIFRDRENGIFIGATAENKTLLGDGLVTSTTIHGVQLGENHQMWDSEGATWEFTVER